MATAEDFRERLLQVPKSFAIGDSETFSRRLAKLEDLLTKLRRLAAVPREQLLADEGLQARAERWLHLAAECTLGLANHLIAEKGWKAPTTHLEAFRRLHQEGVLSAELARDMEGWAGLRNVLVHLYLEVDPIKIYDTLTGELHQLEEYVRALIAHVASDLPQ